jgi:signal transduction histidine kinase
MSSILRSSSFRIAVAFGLAVSITTSGVFAFVYWRVSTADIAQVRGVLQDEAALASRTPIAQMREQLDLRLTHDLRRLDFVGLFSSDGTLLYGNIQEGIPVPVDGAAHLTTALSTSSGIRGPAVFVARRCVDGSTLLLGRSLTEIYRLQATMGSAFITTILPTVLVALITGAIVSYRASHRVVAIRKAIQRVMLGELHVRLPVRRSSDDLNQVVVAVNQMLDEIARLLSQIRSVGDNIAHDLKTPLVLMHARLERGILAGTYEVLDEAAKGALSDLDRALSTVTALLRISELESGTRRSAFELLDLAALCQEVFELFEPLAQQKQIAMTFETANRSTVIGDRGLLQEAVANLVDNAIKFSPRGGEVSLRSGVGPLLVCVSDNGPGVAHEETKKIFKRFYRARATRHVPGVGIGLSMAATIVELHGFELQVRDNAPGAIFEIIDTRSLSG